MRVLQRGLVGSGDSLIPRENIAVFLTLYFQAIYFLVLLLLLGLLSYNYHVRLGLELRVQNFYR
jgi:hypothetical protein